MNMRAPDAVMPQPGPVSRALIRMFMKQARIVHAETLTDDVRLLTIESPAFRGVDWVPGQKIQLTMGSAFVARTYTPIEWDGVAGRTRIVSYAHGSGPGSTWVRNVMPGDECTVFGPRASLYVGRVSGACVMLGDETSIALTYAFRQRLTESAVRCLLEVGDLVDTHEVLGRLGLDGVELFSRSAGDEHLEDMASRLSAPAMAGATFVLTGKASSIQRWRRELSALGVPAARIMAKAYWAPGKTGMD